MNPVKVGIIGCGKICDIYFKNMRDMFKILEVKACADIDMSRAKEKAAMYPGVQAMSVKKLLADPEIEIVVNLTIPKAHFKIAMQAVKAGKSVHNEKPITLLRREAVKLLDAAEKQGVLVGNAPDTFMGAGIQTCRKLIDDGAIGEPVAATAFMTSRGHECWHPDPEFYYEAGGGPMFDMGPYYLTALINLIGPVKSVSGRTRKTFPTRTITSEKKKGKIIPVEVPTHIAGIMDFENGAVGTIIMSFDVWRANLPRIEIYGSEGSLQVPDPNGFGGPVKLFKPGDEDWKEIPLTHRHDGNARGIGPADMAYALRTGSPLRANGKLAFHVLDIMHAFHDASDKNKCVKISSVCEKPASLPPDGLESDN